MPTLTETEIEAIVERTVHKTLLTLGLDVDEPMQIQRDFQHLRTWRTSIETVRRHGLIAAVGIVVVGFMGLVWTALHAGPLPRP